MSTLQLFRRPTAFLPLVMSLAAWALLLGHLAIFGITRGGDEGMAARVFQLLLVAQLPLMGVFAARGLAREPRHALIVLALQVVVAASALGLVAVLER